jgi:hypothetical protein
VHFAKGKTSLFEDFYLQIEKKTVGEIHKPEVLIILVVTFSFNDIDVFYWKMERYDCQKMQ